MSVAAIQRFTARQHCPACDGHGTLPHGRGRRCYGFLSEDGRWAHCTREEYAGALLLDGAGTYPHYLAGPCRCGRAHGNGAPVSAEWPPAKAANPAKDDGRAEAARRLWGQTEPAAGTLVATYLRSRGLILPAPPGLRYAPRLKHGPSGRWLPALVAAVLRWPLSEPIAVHRTYLAPDGSGKAAVEPCRMALGPIGGGAVRCAPAGETLCVAEGIETALSLQQTTGMPAWAVLGASNLPALVLPPLPLARELVIGADPDPTGLRAAHQAAARWTAEGRRVRVVVPPAGSDFNDLVRRAA